MIERHGLPAAVEQCVVTRHIKPRTIMQDASVCSPGTMTSRPEGPFSIRPGSDRIASCSPAESAERRRSWRRNI
jgi:hypothetical protein